MTIRALSKDVAIYGAGEFVFKFIAFSVFPIYARVLSVAEFGRWALIAASTLLLGYLVNLGVSQAVQRWYFDETTTKTDEPRIVSTGLVQLLGSCTLFVTVACCAVSTFGDELERRFGLERRLLFIALAAVLPDQILQYCSDVLRLHFTPLKFLLLSFSKNVIGTAMSIFFLLVLHAGLAGLFTGLLIGSVAAVPIGLWLIRRDLTPCFDRRVAGALFAFGFPLVFASVAHWIYTSLDRWMLAEFTTAQEVGLYSVAARLSTVITFVIAAFAQAWMPFAIRTSKTDPDHAAFFARVLSLWFFLLALGALGFALYADVALRLLTPPPYWPAANCLPLLAAGYALFGTTLVTGLGITLSKKTVLSTVGTWLAAGINFCLNLLLIPGYGARGTAAATLFSYGVLSAFLFYWGQRLKPIPVQSAPLAYCLMLILGASALSWTGGGGSSLMAMTAKAAVLLIAVAGGFLFGIVGRSTVWPIKPREAV